MMKKAQYHDDRPTAKARKCLIGSNQIESRNCQKDAECDHIGWNPVPSEQENGYAQYRKAFGDLGGDFHEANQIEGGDDRYLIGALITARDWHVFPIFGNILAPLVVRAKINRIAFVERLR